MIERGLSEADGLDPRATGREAGDVLLQWADSERNEFYGSMGYQIDLGYQQNQEDVKRGGGDM